MIAYLNEVGRGIVKALLLFNISVLKYESFVTYSFVMLIFVRF